MTSGLKIIFIFLCTLLAQAAVSDFSIQVAGPKSVYRGHQLYLKLSGTILAGTDTDLVTVTITRLPAGVQASWVRNCCGESQIYRVYQPHMLILKADANAALGSNTVVIAYSLPSGLTKQVTYDFTIGDVTTMNPPAVLPANTDLPAVSLWRENAKLARPFCLVGNIGVESDVWYYDGARTYFNVNNILGTQEMFNCAEFQNSLYRRYVLDNRGALPGWRVFPHGLATHYEKTADSSSLEALRLLMNSPWTTPSIYGIDPEVMRDISYAVNVHLENERLGMARRPGLQPLVEQLIGHLEQFFASRQKQAQPFMVGLAAEALIAYWDVTRDPRIVPVLKMAADAMWQESWNGTTGSFAYYNYTVPITRTFDGTADSNLLIAPLYGWVYQRTADVKYRAMGDAIFTAGVEKAWLGGGKQFSQNYRWGHRYIEWRRLSIPTPAPAPAPVLGRMYLFPAIPKAGVSFVMWLLGSGFDRAIVRVVVTGPSCPSGCVFVASHRQPTVLSAKLTLNLRGNYVVAAQNGSGPLSATSAFTVQ